MFDTNTQSQACSRLLASVVFLAVKDATLKPYRKKGTNKLTLSSKADSAIEFFFGFDSPISDLYLSLLGWEPDTFKSALLKAMNSESAFDDTKSLFNRSEKRMFRHNYAAWYRKSQFLGGTYKFNLEYNFED